jgi:anthraniloyl-CoA monooxygenase
MAMRITVLGGGPAGLYFSLLMKKADPSHHVTITERNPPDATYGWGVVFSEETLGALRDADRPSYDEITESFATWSAIDIRYRGQTIRSRGHAFSAIARKRLLQILQRRCAELGVELEFRREIGDPTELGDADLVVAADGVNSILRRANEEAFGPAAQPHRTRFVWFGTDLGLDAFTFIFRENEHGLFQVHAYPFDARTSTFIVECPELTWRRAGLDQATEEESIAYCEKLFADDLAGHSLLSNRSLWIGFVTLRNESWHHSNVVLLGDAAHTAHFTIGSGTKLAMEDAVSLASALERHRDLEPALVDYELERQPMVDRFQQAATESATYFENVSRYADFEPLQFAFNLLTRSGRITHLELEKRDPSLIRMVDAWFASSATATATAMATATVTATLPQAVPVVPAARAIAAPPAFASFRLRDRVLPNRVASSPPGRDDAMDGTPGPELAARLSQAAASGVGLVLTEFVAVSAHGRIGPGTPGLYEDRHLEAWRQIAASVHRSSALVGVRLGHSGARGATRPSKEGLDRPLRRGGWPLLAASELPYAPWSRRPHPMAADKLREVKEDFASAAERASAAGFDLLQLDLSHGYLLAGFLSPLTNRRADRYGGSLENRMRYPLEIVDAVRAVWPGERPLAARLTASDWASRGTEPDDAVAVAAELKAHGCDLIAPVAGQTVSRDRPVYGRFFLVPFSDRIRNEAGIATLGGGNLTTVDEVNTILAAGRADLCLLALG